MPDDVLMLFVYPCGLQMLGSMGDALDLVCQASTALAASIRQTAGWLGHASAQSATPAKLQQVCLRLLAATHPTKVVSKS